MSIVVTSQPIRMFINKCILAIEVFMIALYVANTIKPLHTSQSQICHSNNYIYLIDFYSGKILFNHKKSTNFRSSFVNSLITTHMIYKKLQTSQLYFLDQLNLTNNIFANNTPASFLTAKHNMLIRNLLKQDIIIPLKYPSLILIKILYKTERSLKLKINTEAPKIGIKKNYFLHINNFFNQEYICSPQELTLITIGLLRKFEEYWNSRFLHDFLLTETKSNHSSQSYSNKPKNHDTQSINTTIASATKGSRRLIAVVSQLKTLDKKKDISQLFYFGFFKFKNMIYFTQNQKIKKEYGQYHHNHHISVQVIKKVFITVPLYLKKQDVLQQLILYKELKAPLYKGDIVGELHFLLVDNKTLIKKTKISIKENYIAVNFIQRTMQKFGIFSHYLYSWNT